MLFFSQRIILVFVLSISALHPFVAATPVPGNSPSKPKSPLAMQDDEMLLGYHGTLQGLAGSLTKGIKVQPPGTRRFALGPGFYVANNRADAEFFAKAAVAKHREEKDNGPIICSIYVKTKSWQKIRWTQRSAQQQDLESTKDSVVWGPLPSNPSVHFAGDQLAASQAVVKAVKMRANCQGTETETVNWPTH